MKDKIKDYLKSKQIIVPLYLYKNKKILGITSGAFIFLMYLMNLGSKPYFDINLYSEDLGDDVETIMIYINELINKNLIEINTIKHEKGYLEEYISLSAVYDLIVKIMIEKEREEMPEIFDFIESAFGRPLSSRDYEIIKSWISNDISEDIIKKAVSEAMKNGNSNINYVDRIIYSKIKEEIKDDVSDEIFDYDWLNE